MTLVLVPVGRGNYAEARVRYTGRQTHPLLVRIGERVQMAGVLWRIKRVEP